MKNKKSLLVLSLILLTFVGILFTVNVKASSGSFYIYPNSTHSNNDWEPYPGSTVHGCVADQSESKYIVSNIFHADHVKFNMDDVGLGTKHAYTLVFYMMASTNEGAEITQMEMKVDGTWYQEYVGVNSGWEWYSFEIDGWWDDGDIDAMRTGLETFFGDWNDVRISRVKVLVYWTSFQQ